MDSLMTWIIHNWKELKAKGHLIKDDWGNSKIKQGYPNLIVYYENKNIMITYNKADTKKNRFVLKL